MGFEKCVEIAGFELRFYLEQVISYKQYPFYRLIAYIGVKGGEGTWQK